MNSMIYTDRKGRKRHVVCSTCRIDYRTGTDNANDKKEIPIYYSKQQAVDQGWIFTTDAAFCPPEKSRAWLCPDCAKQYR